MDHRSRLFAIKSSAAVSNRPCVDDGLASAVGHEEEPQSQKDLHEGSGDAEGGTAQRAHCAADGCSPLQEVSAEEFKRAKRGEAPVGQEGLPAGAGQMPSPGADPGGHQQSPAAQRGVDMTNPFASSSSGGEGPGLYFFEFKKIPEFS